MHTRTTFNRTAIILLFCGIGFSTTAVGQEWKSGVEWSEPPVVTPGQSDHDAPSDATVLFDGSNLDQWEGGTLWKIEDGVAVPQQSAIQTQQHFGDMQLHLEWSAPTEIRGEGQGRGNSGIFLMGHYEVQVLDSYENTTYFDGQAGSIYKQTPPMVNAMRKPGEWNTYDIIFTAPRFRVNGDLQTPAYVTLIHNGLVVLNHFELLGPTSYVAAPHYQPHAEKGPISLQFHGDPVKFRNIWVRELNSPVGIRVREPFNLQPPRRRRPADDPPVTDDAKEGADAAADPVPATEKPATEKPATDTKSEPQDPAPEQP